MLEVIILITFNEEHLHPVFNLCGSQAELEGQTEEARLGGPAKLLLFGMRVTRSHGYWGGTLHLHAFVVVLIEDQEGATVWSKEKQLQHITDMYTKLICKLITPAFPHSQVEKTETNMRGVHTYVSSNAEDLQQTQSQSKMYTGWHYPWLFVVSGGEGGVRAFQSWGKRSAACGEQQWHRDMMLSPLNHTDGYPVTWLVKVGQTADTSMCFNQVCRSREDECRKEKWFVSCHYKKKSWTVQGNWGQ